MELSCKCEGGWGARETQNEEQQHILAVAEEGQLACKSQQVF